MKISFRNIPVIVLVALFAINPVMAGLAAAQSCAGHMCCIRHPGIDSHGQKGPAGHAIQAKSPCCCNPDSSTPCTLNQPETPDNDRIVSSHFRVISHGTDTIGYLAVSVDLSTTANRFSGTSDFRLSRGLSPPIYLSNQSLIC